MKTTHTFLHTICILIIMSISSVSSIFAQTYDFSSDKNRWHVNIDSLSHLSPDSIIRLEPLIQNTGLPSQNSDNSISPFSLATSQTHAHIPTSITIDTSKDVGEIPFSSATSPSGGVTYSVPIDVAGGRNGFQPAISIVYNSQGGNDVVGYGWSIAGLSTITRVAKNIYYDGQASPITLGTNDSFVLDGMRLLPVSDKINTYEPEQGNMRIKATISDNQVTSFTVEYPNGSKGTFSTNNNGVTYPIKRLQDALGNYIVFTYETDNNRDYIKKIEYGAHTSLNTHFATIQFFYKTRTDNVTGYERGMQFKLARLLQKIECYDQANLLHCYTFNHQLSDVSLLSRIDLDNLNPLNFYYGYSDNITGSLEGKSSSLGSYFDNSVSVVVSKGKFSYGSDDDGLIIYPDKSPCLAYYKEGSTFSHSTYYYFSGFHPDQSLLVYQYLSNDVALPTELKAGNGFQTILAADIDGKPGEEVLKINNELVGDQDVVTIKAYKPNLYTILNLESTFTFNSESVTHYDNKSFWPKIFLPGDYNGDGKMELLAVSMYKPLGKADKNSKCFLFDLSNNKVLFNASVFNFDIENSSIIPMDVNGDGKTEVCHIHRTGMDVYSFTGNSIYSLTKLFTDNNITYPLLTSKTVMIGDVNGDGKVDFLVSPTKSFVQEEPKVVLTKSWDYCPLCSIQYPNNEFCPGCHGHIGYSNYCVACWQYLVNGVCPQHGSSCTVQANVSYHNGTKWSVYSLTGTGSVKNEQDIMECNRDYKYILQDANADGFVDIVEYNDRQGFKIAFNENGQFATPTDFTNGTLLKGSLISSSVSHRNYHNFVLLVSGSSVHKTNYTKNVSKNHLLTGSVNSFGVIQRNYYRRLNENKDLGDNFYTKGDMVAFPYENFMGPLWAVSKQENLINGAIFQTTSYSYKGAIAHRQGLGFSGFTEFTTYDQTRSRYSTKTFDPLKFGIPVKDVNPFTQTDYTYTVNVASNKKATVRLLSLQTKDLLKNATITKKYQYVSSDNPRREDIQYAGPGLDAIRTIKTIIYVDTISDSKYIIGLPTATQTQESRNSKSSYLTQYLTYEPGTPLIKKSVSELNGIQAERSEWKYDNCGNVISEKSAPYTKTELLETTYTYDANKRYVKTKTNALGQTTTYYSYNKYGSPTDIRDFNQNITIYTYDALGRAIVVTNPDETQETTSYNWSGVSLYCVTQNATGKPQQITYFDALNREVRKKTLAFNGTWRNVDTQYDVYGRVEKVSLPYRVNPLWTSYGYDNYDRVTSVTEASGRTITTSYSQNNVTTVQDGITKTSYYDNSGELLEYITDPAGTISYYYTPDKQIKEIITPGDIRTTFDYDAAGRQIKITDPSAGTKTFDYDAAGNVSKETDAVGNVVRMEYDTFNRLIKKEYVGELVTEYKYTNGLLVSETSNNGIKKEYSYDPLLRLEQEKEYSGTNNGQYLLKYYTYSNGNVSNISYITNDNNLSSPTIGYEEYIYTNGSLSEIKWSGNTTIWKLTSENDLGQPIGCTTGGYTRSYAYDAYGKPTGRVVKYGSKILQNFSYSFSPQTGNLLWRKDNIRNIQENFGYDNMNRLTSFAGKTTSYDVKGNITQLTGIGTLNYDVSKPYAVSSVVPAANCQIPSASQTVTYNGLMRPKSISQNGYKAAFKYNGEGKRVRMDFEKPKQARIVGGYAPVYCYLGDRYETYDYLSEVPQKIFYIGGDAYNAPAVYVKNGDLPWTLYYICRDYLGSITHVVDASGNLVQELSYDAWGNLRNPQTQIVYTPGSESKPFLRRGYTGHEHLIEFGLINMNARLYDPALGRFLSPDPYVQAPENSQNFNRYSYCLNNPLIYTDENGEFFFSLFLGPIGAFIDAACWGAVIGAGTSAAIYSISALVTGQSWNGGDFWRSVGMGALGGALGGGMGYIGSTGLLGSFGNTFGYSMLSEISNTVITNYTFGNDMNWGSMLGMAGGALAGSFLPTFKGGVQGQNVKNALLETGYNTVRGAATGFASGGINALVNKDVDYIWQGVAGGAISGAGRSIFMNLAFGAPYKTTTEFKTKNGEIVTLPALQRDGGLLNIWGDITLGRNASACGGRNARHESVHVLQQERLGWASFYGKTILQYMSAFLKTGDWQRVYSTSGTLEYEADREYVNVKIYY